MAVNAIGEIIPVQNAEAGCSKLHKDYICDADDVIIYKADALYDKGNAYNDMQCALKILRLRSGTPQDPNCDSEWICGGSLPMLSWVYMTYSYGVE